jgi:hypothetical protein
MSRAGGRAALLVAVVVMAVTAAQAAPAAAVPDQAGPTIELVDQTTWLHAGDPFQVSAQVTGAPAGAVLQVVVHERLRSRAQFQRTLGGDLGDTELTLDPRPLAELGPASGPFTTGFVVGGEGQGLDGPGVYPVELRLVDTQGAELGGLLTHLTYLPDPQDTSYTPLSVAVVLDVSGPPALQPDGSVHRPPTTIDRARERADLLADTPDVPLTLAPQPETLDGLAGSGTTGAATVRALVGASGERPVLARPYTDVDLAALGQSGLVAEADQQTEAGARAVLNRFGPGTLSGIWLAGATLGNDAARHAVDLGIERALVPPSAVEDDDSGSVAGPVPDAPVAVNNELLAMVSDPELAEHLTGDRGVIDAQRFLAELAMMWFERPATPRAVAVHVPGEDPIEAATVARALNGLTHGQAVQAVPLDRVFDVPRDPEGPTTAELSAHEIDDELGGIAGPLRQARRGVGAVADTLAADGASLERSLLLATGSATPDGQRDAYVERVTSELGSLDGAVVLPDAFRITLTSRTSTVPVNITNNLDQPLTVRIEFDSAQLDFLEGDFITQELPPGATRLEVPVRALTSGAFTMGITVLSPDSSLELDRTTFDVRSTAVTGVGFVLSIGAGLFLAVWWARHWRKSRRSRHLLPAGEPPAVPADGTVTAADGDPTVTGAPGRDDTGDYRPAHLAGSRPRRD